ncbi:tRNA methyltransferase ppm2 [Penicillium lividum]|nr:tRNA methyltransferase ppm2 [Penicillium lividum]
MKSSPIDQLHLNQISDKIVQIPRVRIKTAAQAQQIVANGKPVVIGRSDIRPCTELWMQEYLTSSVGDDRNAATRVHEAQSEKMNFQHARGR